MTGAISVGLDGIAGWRALQRLAPRQKEILANNTAVLQSTNYFNDRIELTRSTSDLMGDYRMLKLALGAFGLEEDISNRGFIQKVLDSDLADKKSFANRLSDKRYLRLAEAFNFHARENTGAIAESHFLRLAGLDAVDQRTRETLLAARNSLTDLARRYDEDHARYHGDTGRSHEKTVRNQQNNDRHLLRNILADQDVAKIFTDSFGLNREFSALERDQQVAKIVADAQRQTGAKSLRELLEPEKMAQLFWNYAFKNSTRSAVQNDPDPIAGLNGKRRDAEFIRRVSLGQLSPDDRQITLNARNKLSEIAQGNTGDQNAWRKALRDPDLELVLKQALELPENFSNLRPDDQDTTIRIAADRVFETISFRDLADSRNTEYLIGKFLFKSSYTKTSAEGPPRLHQMEQISDSYLGREFERRVGQSDETFRLALNAQRELQAFAGRGASEKALWYEVIGTPPLRQVFEAAFGFGREYGKLDVDRQVHEFTKMSRHVLGTSSFTEIGQPAVINKLIEKFLIRSQIETSVSQNRYSAALTLLS